MNFGKTLFLMNLWALSLLPNYGFAAEKEASFQLDEYVVTATRSQLTLKEVPKTMEVITREDIEALGATSVRDVLKYATNLYLAEGNGQHGDNLTMRGSGVNDILILHNGRRLPGENFYAANRDSGNARTLERFNLSNVERIEIVRGQAGALYGSDAQAGVINIITKKSEQPSFAMGFNTGSRQMNNYYHWDSGKSGKVSAVVDANFNKLRNFDSKAEGFTHGPGQSYSLDLDYDMDEDNRLNLYLDYTKQKYDFASSSNGFTWDNHRDYERKIIALTYEGQNAFNSYSLSASYGELVSEHREKEFYFKQGGRPELVPKNYEREYKLWNVEARDTIQLAENNRLTLGGEVRTVKGGAYVENAKDETEQYSLYLQEELTINDKLLVIPSLRYDEHDTFGGQSSPNLGATYFLTERSRLKANYGKSYRAPSVDELYGTFDHMGLFTFYGNPDLQPEETTGWELSYEQEFGDDSKARLTYFANKKDNAISYTALANGNQRIPNYRFVNIEETSTKGVELAYEQALGKGLKLLVDYAYLDARNEVSHERLNFSARNTYTAKLFWTEEAVNPWIVVLFNRWYSDYYNDGKNYSINTFNVAVNKKWGSRYRSFVAIDNLFDKKNESINAYGRLWRAGVELTF